VNPSTRITVSAAEGTAALNEAAESHPVLAEVAALHPTATGAAVRIIGVSVVALLASLYTVLGRDGLGTAAVNIIDIYTHILIYIYICKYIYPTPTGAAVRIVGALLASLQDSGGLGLTPG